MTQENENATQEDASPSGGPGEQLCKAREARNLTQHQVATQLRMQLRIIEALESDDYSDLPGATFVQGYLRSYARLLGLPEESILGLAKPEQKDEPKLVSSISEGKLEASSSDLPFRLITALIFLVVVVGLGWWFSQQTPSSELSQTEKLPSSAGEQGLWLPEEGESLQGSSDSGSSSSEQADEASVPDKIESESEAKSPLADELERAAEPEVEVEVEAEGAVPVTEPVAEDAPVPPTLTDATPQSHLELEYQADSWSEISDAAGRKLTYGLVTAGTNMKLRGEAPFKVFLGYASGVTVYYNNDLYDHSPFQRGDVARFRIGRAEHNQPLSGN